MPYILVSYLLFPRSYINVCGIKEGIMHNKGFMISLFPSLPVCECNAKIILMFSVIHSSKLPNNMLPRILEDEGFYIPRKPYIPRNTYHKMENRLLQQEGGTDWFEESGEIISLPSPVKQAHHCRVSFPVEADTQLRTTYRKVCLGSCCFTRIITTTGEESKIYQLDLNISSIVFNHHSLFNCEQVLASKLLNIYECFQKRCQQNVTHLLSEKLKALTSATKLKESNLKISQLSTNTLKDFRSQIRHTKRLYDKERQRDSSLIQSMLKIWKQIKSVRIRQGFVSTTKYLMLYILKHFNGTMSHFSTPVISGLMYGSIFKANGIFPLIYFICIPRNEQKRRDRVKLEKYLIKIYYNNKLVSSTPEAPLCQEFKVMFQQMFRIQVLNWPESLCLEVSKKPSLLARVYLAVPSVFILKSKDVLDEVEFSCEQQVYPLDGAVGSNVPFLLENETEELCILTSGKVIYSLFWAVDDKGVPLAPTFQPISVGSTSMSRNVRSGRGIGTWWHSDIQKCIEWANEANIDPNDPDYTDLFELITYARSLEQSNSKYFRLEQLHEEFNFVTAEEIENCKRFQLLQLRSLGQLDFYCFQQIPLYDREISDTIFQVFQFNSQSLFYIVLECLLQVRKQIVTIRHKYNLSDIVSDYEEIISMSQLSDAIFKLGERRRHLKPQRKERRKIPAQAVSDGDVKLLIRILRTAFVFTADGSHPCWNEELQVDFTSPGHDYTFSGLSKIKDNININIFDEFVIEKSLYLKYQQSAQVFGHSYVRKNWLGSVTFPFSALLEQSKICGTFQVSTPPILLGYTWSKTYVPPKEECYGQNLKEYTFLTIFATVEPQLSSAENNLQPDKVDETLLQRAYIFKQACKMLFPKRRIITSVFDNQGRNVLVTKYITPLNPPQVLLDMYPDDPNSISDLVSRFVSLIPCMSDTVDENGDVDIWMTSEHCIKWGICNKEEHAVLLCNYLLYIGKKAWLLLGASVLEGKVAYVASQENGEFFLWNPLSGQCYKQFDAFCPLQSVDCLINQENVWFNMQQNSSPMCVSFDISKECFWKQMLPVIPQDLKTQTVQPKKIHYIPTDESLIEELQNRIEKTLKNKIMEWRSQHPTRWHRQCTNVLRQLLPKLEFRNGHTAKEKEENYLETFHEHYWVTGFPIQMLYLDVQSITEAVYQTGIHSSEVPNTEFALAVYIHPYPNNMLSVWIYLVSLIRHQ
uniref:Uncharacterized protein n=1 Tax=Anolis carolinensis TaxID=28377 RepID=H9GB19_ANOCA